MNQVYTLLIIPMSAYSFATAVQMTRGIHLNIKPFNCKFCLSFWFSLIAYLVLGTSIAYAILCAFYVAFIAHFLKIIEDKLLESKYPEPDLSGSLDLGGQDDKSQN
jgi:hypothetical protein